MSRSACLTGRSRTLAIRLAMAMFVLVVDTSLMNVSISAVVRDLDTTVSARPRVWLNRNGMGHLFRGVSL